MDHSLDASFLRYLQGFPYGTDWESGDAPKMSSKLKKSYFKWTLINQNKRLRLCKKPCNFLDEEFVSNMMKANEKNNINYVLKGKALKQKSAQKEAEVKSLEESLLELQEKEKF